MLTAGLLFAANFALVFTLGLQQLNVSADRRVLAFITSLLISAANLVLFKVLPGPIDFNQVAAYAFGGAFGIVASMWAHPRLVALIERPMRSQLPFQVGDYRCAQCGAEHCDCLEAAR